MPESRSSEYSGSIPASMHPAISKLSQYDRLYRPLKSKDKSNVAAEGMTMGGESKSWAL